MFPEIENIPLQKITNALTDSQQLNLFVLRLDLAHPHISGNKWFKLKYNLEEARRQGKNTLLTFGGAYSNHIIAVAAAGKELGFKTIGVIRGEELANLPSAVAKAMADKGREQSAKNSVLEFAEECGMKLHFISREEYREKDADKIIKSLNLKTETIYVLPEGGTNELAVKGTSEITSLINIPFDYVCCAVGTGGTIAGIISSLKEKQQMLGFSVLKGGDFLNGEVKKYLPAPQSEIYNPTFEINIDYHFGGYAKKNDELLNFISDFKSVYNIPLDFVYTGKMMYGIFDLIRKNYFPEGSTIIAVHTGGTLLH